MTTTSLPSTSFDLRALLNSKDAVLALSLVIIIGLMLIPLPPMMVDLMIAANLALSLSIILLTIYVTKPMEFSVFPTMLLMVTLLRLGINVSASRLILLDGNAGKVIETFGKLVVGGNYVIGIVIFLMLMIIQWVVINAGAGRVAEVAARFTLDAMPGKQMSIDADLNAGMIDEVEARRRRREIQSEADFYGTMDGSSKFVKGDSVAAVIIILVNILGGVVIGILQRQMDVISALQSYTLLTIGAGLAVQIPALLVSAATGLLVTRSTSEASLGNVLTGQLANFNVMLVGALIIGVLALVPGMPKIPFLAIGALLGGAAYLSWRGKQQAAPATPAAEALPEAGTPQDMLEMVVVDPMELEIGYALIPLIDDHSSDNLLHRITNIRRQLMAELGLVLPVVRVRDNLNLQPQVYRIKIRGEEIARGEILLGRCLAIPGAVSEKSLHGTPTIEPAFGLPAIWISETDKGRAELMGYTVVNPLSVLSTHLAEAARNHAPDLLSRQMVQEMLGQLRVKTPAAVEGVIPELLNLGDILAILRNLLRERIPIRDLGGILEVLAANVGATRDPDILAEAVRQTMARGISNQYRDADNYLHVFTLAPQLEATLRASLGNSDSGLGFRIEADLAQAILARTGDQMEKLARQGHYPILLCSREVRLAFRRMVERSLPNLVVLAFSEVSAGTKVKAYGMVEMIKQSVLQPSAAGQNTVLRTQDAGAVQNSASRNL